VSCGLSNNNHCNLLMANVLQWKQGPMLIRRLWWGWSHCCRSFVRSNDFWLSYDPWTLKFCQIFSCHHFFSLCLEILTWFLVWECIIISYRSILKFIRLNEFLPTYSRWVQLSPIPIKNYLSIVIEFFS
jgi:hypothetical protein